MSAEDKAKEFFEKMARDELIENLKEAGFEVSDGEGEVILEEDFTMRKFPVAEHLTDDEYKLLLEVYAKHNTSMSLSERGKYSLSNIVAIKRNIKENCLNVYYDNGEWWHYTKDREWY